ncbi:MAG: hypothetical protein JEZ00_16805 [Anaerolineaceae bacterium]|nr:hypothetical protein [Anaerolineaceae bacterium]
MLKQLKWDAIDLWKRYGWTFLVIPMVFFLALIPSNNNTPSNAVLITLISGISGLGILYLIVLANLMCFNWLIGNQTQLHFSLPVAPWKMILSKLLLAATLNTFTSLFSLQIMLMASKYSVGTFRWISLNELNGIPDIIMFMTLINMTFIFSNVFVRSIQWARVPRIMFTLGITFVIIFSLILLVIFANYPLWIGIVAVLFLAEFFGSIVLIKHFAHLE